MRKWLAAVTVCVLAGCGSSAVSHVSQPSPAGPTVRAKAVAKPTTRPTAVNAPIPEDLGPMVASIMAGPHFSGRTESHASTGLVRDDFFDWPAAAVKIAAEHPSTVILMMGGNDNQPIVLPGKPYLQPATPAWQAEYARRAGLVLDALRQGGVKRVYWLTMPTTLLTGMNPAIASMGEAIQTAGKGRLGVTVYDTDVLLGADAGKPISHQPDGIHLSTLGSQMISNALAGQLRRDAGRSG